MDKLIAVVAVVGLLCVFGIGGYVMLQAIAALNYFMAAVGAMCVCFAAYMILYLCEMKYTEQQVNKYALLDE